MAKPTRTTYVDAQLYAMLQAVQKRMARDSGWRVVARGRDWLCPYCGEIGFTGYDPQRAPRDVLKHLVHACPHWAEDVGTRFSQKDLLVKARRLDTEELLRTSRAWRMADATGRWYCPYCAEATDVPWQADNRERSPDPELVCAHLEQCKANRDGRKPYPVEVIHQAVEDADRGREFTVAVRLKIESDAAWQKVADGKWVCPRCHQSLPDVDFVTDAQKQGVAPRRIARHLLERCKPQKEGAAPTPTPAGPPPAEVTVTHQTTQLVLHEEEPEPDQERAREAIQNALPTEALVLEGYDVSFLRRAGTTVGGTFHDCFYVSPEDVALLVCGLQSRGLDAATAIASLKKSIHQQASHHRSPAEVLRRVNEAIATEFGSREIITAFYGVLGTQSGTLTYARAGHSMPILYNVQDEPPLRELNSRGVALGIQQGAAFDQAIEEVAIRFRHGDTLVVYGGGVADAVNASTEPYGVERLGAVIGRAQADSSSRALTYAVAEDVQRFLGNAPPKDDMTILCLRCL